MPDSDYSGCFPIAGIGAISANFQRPLCSTGPPLRAPGLPASLAAVLNRVLQTGHSNSGLSPLLDSAGLVGTGSCLSR